MSASSFEAVRHAFGDTSSTKPSSKKFQFRAQPQKPCLELVTQTSSSSSSSVKTDVADKKVKKKYSDAFKDDDIWMDDIDEQMLVQASQMVEADNDVKSKNLQGDVVCTEDERMEIDAAALSMLIMEEDKTNGDNWGETTSSKNVDQRFNQTQTVFQDKVVAARQNVKTAATMLAPTIRAPMGTIKREEELERVKAENKTLNQKQYAKTGEISFLRGELSKRQNELDVERKEKAKILEQKAIEFKNFEAAKKAAVETVLAEKDFIRRELDQATETLRNLEKDGANKKRPQVELTKPPVAKKQKLSASQMTLPSTIDESLLLDGDHGSPRRSRFKPVQDSGVQTVSTPQRTFVLSLKHESVVSRTVNIASHKVLKSLSSESENNSLIRIFSANSESMAEGINQLVANSRDVFAKMQKSDFEASLVQQMVSDLRGARVLMDHLDTRHSKQLPENIVTTLISFLSIHKSAEVVAETFSLLKSAVTKESLLDTASVNCVLEALKNCLRKYDVSETASTTTLNVSSTFAFLDNIFQLLRSNSSLFADKLCINSKDSCFIYFLWSVISNLSFEFRQEADLLSQSFVLWLSSNQSSLGLSWVGPLTRTVYEDKNATPKIMCRWCRSDVLKLLSTLTWTVTDGYVKREISLQSTAESSNKIIKDCLVSLHQVWSTDPAEFVKCLGESPSVQRRYVWATRHISRLRHQLDLSNDEVALLTDLIVECDDTSGKT